MLDFDGDRLRAAAEARGLRLPDAVLAQVTAAIKVGQHLILTGAPGTGKTTLAMAAADAARSQLHCTGYRLATASNDWTTDETVGGYRQTDEGMIFHSGLVLGAIEAGEWVIVDELNRAPADRVFGELFTVLSGQSVILPFKRPGSPRHISLVPYRADVPEATDPVQVPASWRLLGTMNTADRDLLHQLSSALLRRFAVIEVPSPSDEDLRALLRGPGGAALQPLVPLRETRDLGPGIWLAAATLTGALLEEGLSTSAAVHGAFCAHLLPQLDGLDHTEARTVRNLLAGVLDAAELAALDTVLPEVEAPEPIAVRLLTSDELAG